jgi:uncharacterized protein (DUF1684 family)
MNIKDWKRRIESERQAKDWFFASHPNSPVPPEDRNTFEGLAYYPPDPNYRFELFLQRHQEEEIQEVTDTGGQTRQLKRLGEFQFTLDQRECALQCYQSDPAKESLFVLFKDQTSGEETYAAGRYLDLDPDTDRMSEGRWILDFNQAYNPWCAYSDHYVCPFVPPENWLDVPILAGEKEYPVTRQFAG